MQTTQSPSVPTLTVVEILDRAFRIYRDNFLAFVGLVAIVTVPLTLISLVLNQAYLSEFQNLNFSSSQSSFSSATNNYIAIAGLISILVAVLQAVFVNGTITYMASENHLGRKITIRQAFEAGRGRFAVLFGALVVFYLIVVLLAIASSLTLLCLVGFLGFGVLAYVFVNMNVFLAPVIMLENVGGMQGLMRGWVLAKTRFWTVFGLMLLIGVLSFVLSFAFSALQQLLTGQVISAASLQTSTVAASILSLVIGVLITPIAPIAFTLMYYDTRVRLEGLDIALQATGKPDARPSDVLSPPVNANINRKDLVNILILIVGVVVIALVFGASMAALVNSLLPAGAGQF
jgi:hypothetical protein